MIGWLSDLEIGHLTLFSSVVVLNAAPGSKLGVLRVCHIIFVVERGNQISNLTFFWYNTPSFIWTCLEGEILFS